MATISTATTTSTSTATTRSATAMATEPRKSYHELCRLCASYDAVRMHIFGREGKNRQLVDKIQTCLPFKVSLLLFVRALCATPRYRPASLVGHSRSIPSISLFSPFILFFRSVPRFFSLFPNFVYFSESPPSALRGPARFVLDLIFPIRDGRRQKVSERGGESDGERRADSRTTRSVSTGRYWVKVFFPPPCRHRRPSRSLARSLVRSFARSPSGVLGDEFHPVWPSLIEDVATARSA